MVSTRALIEAVIAQLSQLAPERITWSEIHLEPGEVCLGLRLTPTNYATGATGNEPLVEITALCRPSTPGITPWRVTETLCLAIEDAVKGWLYPVQSIVVDGQRVHLYPPTVRTRTRELPGEDGSYAAHSLYVSVPYSS